MIFDIQLLNRYKRGNKGQSKRTYVHSISAAIPPAHLPVRHYEHKQHTFDSYCKKVLKCEAWNGYREISRRQKQEVPFSELPEEAMEQLAAWDRYPWEYTPFPVGNDVILIEDDRLADALNILPPKDRDIFLMFWFLELADREIGEIMHMARRTVNTHKRKAYRLLIELMGGEADD